MASVAALPSGAALPTLEQLQQVTALHQAHSQLCPTIAEYLGEDWATQGDWVGRYGRQFAVLCAARAPLDHDIQNVFGFSATGEMGPNHVKGDGLRRWVHWVRTDNNRCLYDPIPGYRRQADWDDHGERYQTAHEGPDIWIALDVPAGTHYVSLYFMNKDGHDGDNRDRDYLVELKHYTPRLEEAGSLPTIAHARVRDFWGGVYTRFVLAGPSKFWLKIGKNNSLNTIVSGVFIDQLTGLRQPTDYGKLGWMGSVPFAPPDPDAPEPIDPHLLDQVINGKESLTSTGSSSARSDDLEQAFRLWRALDAAETQDGTCPPPWRDRVYAYRAARHFGASEALLTNWRWKLRIWEKSDREQFAQTMAKAHESLIKLNPQMAGQDY